LLVCPTIADGVTGFLLKPKVRAALCPQLLTARTDSVPDANALPMLSEMLLVPCPDMMVVFVGAVHV